MRALLLLLAFTLSSPSFAGQPSSPSHIDDRDALVSINDDLSSSRDAVRYKAARRFFFGVKGLKEQNPHGLIQGDEQYQELRDVVLSLYCSALYDKTEIRVYAIKGLRQIIAFDLLPDPFDEPLILSIWLDILKIADDPYEPKPVRQAAAGQL